MALALRPLFIFFDVTLLGFVLLKLGKSPDLGLDGEDERFERLDTYFGWLADLFPLNSDLSTGLAATGQLAVAALLVASVLGAALGGLIRLGRVGKLVSGLSVPLQSLAGPGLGIILLYWLAIRSNSLPAFGYTSFGDDAAEAVRSLVLPALSVGIPMAPAMATMLGDRDPYAEPYGVAAAGSALASRSEPRLGWRFGVPAGLLAVGLLTAERLFARPGLFRVIVDAVFFEGTARALDALALIALGGAGVALVVDLVGLRAHYPAAPTTAGLRLASYSTARPSRVMLGLAISIAALLGILGAWGRIVDAESIDVRAVLQQPLSGGHLLGTDSLGRDLLAVSASGLGSALLIALIPSLLALLVAVVLAVLQRSASSVGQIVPGAVIDALWWPLPVLMLLGVAAFGGDLGYLNPLVLALITVGLLPTALRMLRRDDVSFDGGGWIRFAGTWMLLAATTFVAHVAVTFAGISGGAASPGRHLADGLPVLASSVWPAAVATTAITLSLFAFNSLGACLIQLGWHRTAQRLGEQFDAEAEEDPLLLSGQPEPYDESFDEAAYEQQDISIPLVPNYALQPGLPQVDPNDDTVTMADLPTIPPPPLATEERF